jgi:alpha-L-rhamnosidase
MAGILGKPEDALLYASKKQQLQKKIHETFFDETTNTYATGTQIDLTFPMIAGAVPEEKLKAVENSLYHETEVIRDGHLATGLVGLPVLAEWVVKNNAADLMYSMLKKRNYPGYLYMIDNGATTTGTAPGATFTTVTTELARGFTRRLAEYVRLKMCRLTVKSVFSRKFLRG